MILGIIAAIAIPTYKTYVSNAKIAEAYPTIDELSKRQISFFSDQKYFESSTWAYPQLVWDDPDNRPNRRFDYTTPAGKILADGTECSAAICDGHVFDQLSLGFSMTTSSPSGTKCQQELEQEELGIKLVDNMDWTIIRAMQRMDPVNTTTTCTFLFRHILVSPDTNGVPVTSPVLKINLGK
ncbi:MAG: hypothetical protein R2877_00065 [Bdellovibrionota bacterium]